MRLWLPTFTASTQQQHNVLLIMTLQQSAFLLKALGMHLLSHPKYMKRTPKLWLRSSGHQHQLTATLTPSTVSMMTGDDKCFVCGQTGHFDHHCPEAHCHGPNEFRHFAQDCPHKIPLSGNTMPPCKILFKASIHLQLEGQITTYYGCRYRRHHSRSQFHPHLHHDRSHMFRRHTSHSSSSHCNNPHHPSVDGCPIMITTGIVTPNSLLAISPTGTTHTTPWTKATLPPSAPITQHKILSPGR